MRLGSLRNAVSIRRIQAACLAGAVAVGPSVSIAHSDSGSASASASSSALRAQSTSPGYWMLDSAGNVYPFGSAAGYGSASSLGVASSMSALPNGTGYWVVSQSGSVDSFGSATAFSLPTKPTSDVVAIATTHDGNGYWITTSQGQVIAAGDAVTYGSPVGSNLNSPIVGMVSTPDSGGYWLLGGDGGIFAYGDAGFFGSTGNLRLNAPAIAMASTATGKGYWFVASDGGVFAFGDAGFFGSTYQLNPAQPAGKSNSIAPVNKPVKGIVGTADGNGYWMVASDGGVFAFGDAGFVGSLGSNPPVNPIVGFASVGPSAGGSGTGNSGVPACSAPASAQDNLVSSPAAPHGIFVLAGSTPLAQTTEGQDIQQYLLSNPDVCGATVFVNWSLIDNGPSASPRYNWSVIDDLIAPWQQVGKVVNLLLDVSGFQDSVMQGVPSWLQPQLQTVTCGASIQPVYWQSVFVSAWQNYVTAVEQHYASDPNIGYLRIGVADGAQTLIVGTQSAGTCQDSWNAAGYQTQWPACVQQMISFAGSLNSPKQLIVSFNDYSNYPAASQVYQWDAQYGVGTGFSGLQSFDATAFQSGQPCGKQDTNWCALDDQYAGKIPFFVQTLGSSYPGTGVTVFEPNQMEAQSTGPLPPLLQTALASHVQIYEIYSQDLLLAFDPSWPGYSQYSAQYIQSFATLAGTVGTAGGVSPSAG
ncbi:MAG TPA: hypothetical protein VMU77_05730 [Acidimicrobiales bacterium]|nr:hypothetical protein [Acidimicrobiales bacterium]